MALSVQHNFQQGAAGEFLHQRLQRQGRENDRPGADAQAPREGKVLRQVIDYRGGRPITAAPITINLVSAGAKAARSSPVQRTLQSTPLLQQNTPLAYDANGKSVYFLESAGMLLDLYA